MHNVFGMYEEPRVSTVWSVVASSELPSRHHSSQIMDTPSLFWC